MSQAPLNPPMPPTSVASPSQMKIRPGEEEAQWYRPGFAETLRLMRWRVIYFLPALLLLVAIFVLAPMRFFRLSMLLFYWKFILIVVAIPIGAAMTAAARAVRMRKEPFCIHCG